MDKKISGVAMWAERFLKSSPEDAKIMAHCLELIDKACETHILEDAMAEVWKQLAIIEGRKDT